jgi:lipid-binding SYLF domain-containing protein
MSGCRWKSQRETENERREENRQKGPMKEGQRKIRQEKRAKKVINAVIKVGFCLSLTYYTTR